VREMQEALRIDPRNFDLSVRIADVRIGNLKRAAQAARDAARANPSDAGLQASEQATLRALLDARMEEFSRRVKEHPLDLAERFRLGQVLLQADRLDEAAAEFQQTVRDPNRKTDSLLLLAKTFEKKGLLSLAVKKLEEAVADFPALTSPRAKDVHYEYADLLERKGDKEKARQIFEQIFEVDITFRDVSKRLEGLTKGS
jgi:tetratricopeptide (TPR) repeat protein